MGRKRRADERYEGRVVVVVGGASGLGLLTARSLESRGANVVIADYSRESLAAVSEEGFPGYHVDVREPASVERLVAEVEGSHGPVFRVTITAAVAPGADFVRDTPDSVARVMRTNVEGVANVLLAWMPRLLERRDGEVVVYGSVAGEFLSPSLSAYCASKAAVNAYVEVIAWELRERDVFVHLACPPGTKTGLLDQMRSPDRPGIIDQGLEQGVFAEPEDVVRDVERAIDRGERRSYPAKSARALNIIRRVSPRLMWWMIERSV